MNAPEHGGRPAGAPVLPSSVRESRGRRVLFCANTAWSMYQFRKGLLSTLVGEGYEVHVAAPTDLNVKDLEALGCIFHPVEMAAQGRNPLADVRLMLALAALYRNIRPEIVIHYTIKPNIFGTLAARLAGVPSVAVITGLGYVFINHGLISRLSKMLYRAALRFSREVWFLNEADRRTFVTGGLVDMGKTRRLPGEGIDTVYYAPQSDRGDGVEREFRFLLIARMLWDKGVGEYVEAARQLKARYPHARFQLLGALGEGNPSAIPAAQMETWTAQGLVEYLGATTDVRPAIAAAHCVVLPSYREGVPRVLMEASAMARPVIASAVPGCVDVVEDGVTGLLCRVRDPADLSGKMACLLEAGPDSRRRMGAAGRAKMQADFDETLVIAHYRQLLCGGERPSFAARSPA